MPFSALLLGMLLPKLGKDYAREKRNHNLEPMDHWVGRRLASEFQERFSFLVNSLSLFQNSKLMKREGVRSVPSFHFWVNSEKVDVVNGANPEAIEAAITKAMASV